MRRYRTWAVWVVIGTAACAASAVGGPAPLPTPAQQAAVRNGIIKCYQDLYSSPRRADQLILAGNLLSDAHEEPSPTRKFVLLAEARDLAARAGNLPKADQACLELSDAFAISLAAARQSMFEHAMPALFGDRSAAAYVRLAMRSVEAALQADDFTPAQAILQLADSAANKVKDDQLAAGLLALRHDLASQREKYAAIKPTLDALAAHPNDPAANAAAGRYACFVKGDWKQGLAMLLKGNDPALQTLARRDLSEPSNSESCIALGDAWYHLAEKQPLESANIRLRAFRWYLKAMPMRPGDEDPVVEDRIAELEPLAERQWHWGEIWHYVREALWHGQVAASNPAGGAVGSATFQELPQGGAILIGFRYSVGKFMSADTIPFIQAIYRTPEGEFYGQPNGTSTQMIWTVKAPADYAIGAVTVRYGANLDGIQLTFMRIGKAGLNPNDCYRSAPIGNPRGHETTLGGDGLPILGISANVRQDGKLSGLGLIVMQPPPSLLASPLPLPPTQPVPFAAPSPRAQPQAPTPRPDDNRAMPVLLEQPAHAVGLPF